MTDLRQIFADPKVAQEFLDRFPQLAAPRRGGLESLDNLPLPWSLDEAASSVRSIQEGTGGPIDNGFEAIILRFGRPAYFVRDDAFDTADAPSSSEEINAIVNGARPRLLAAIPSVGRVDLRNHAQAWVGTGWVVRPGVVVTNRHVALTFAAAEGPGFTFVESFDGRQAKAFLDTRRELGRPAENVFRLKRVLWIEPPKQGHPDVAFFSFEPTEDDQAPPIPIELMTTAEFDELAVESWTAVIGYPARSPFNNAQDQQRIFDGVFDVKRLQPGKLTSKTADGRLTHDATTLGGNSGSLVLDLASGKAAALHYGGFEGDTNWAVAAPVVAQLLADKVP